MLKWFSQNGNLYLSYNSKAGLNFYFKSQSLKLTYTCWNFSEIAKAGRLLKSLADYYLQNQEEFKEKLNSNPIQIFLQAGENAQVNIVINGQAIYFRFFENGNETLIFPIPLEDLIILADYLDSYKVALVVADMLSYIMPNRNTGGNYQQGGQQGYRNYQQPAYQQQQVQSGQPYQQQPTFQQSSPIPQQQGNSNTNPTGGIPSPQGF